MSSLRHNAFWLLPIAALVPVVVVPVVVFGAAVVLVPVVVFAAVVVVVVAVVVVPVVPPSAVPPVGRCVAETGSLTLIWLSGIWTRAPTATTGWFWLRAKNTLGSDEIAIGTWPSCSIVSGSWPTVGLCSVTLMSVCLK